jgi:nitrate reductase delta subunit
MTDETRRIFKLLSILLEYPEDEAMEHIEECRIVASRLSDGEVKSSATEFISYLGTTPLIELQETYTATFDLNPSTSLNLSYHKWGDGRERGNALAGLVDLYLRAGYGIAEGDLPDFLPLVLEFLSIGPPETARRIMAELHPQASILASRLAESGSPYMALVEGVARLFEQESSDLTGRGIV